jgi:hypothetical protein
MRLCAVASVYFPGILSGMLRPEDPAMREIEHATPSDGTRGHWF